MLLISVASFSAATARGDSPVSSGQVVVTIIGPNGDIIAGAPVILKTVHPPFTITSAKTDQRGRVFFVPPRVLYALPLAPLGVGAGIFLTKGGTLRVLPTEVVKGRVVDRENKPVVGAKVEVNYFGFKSTETETIGFDGPFPEEVLQRWRAVSTTDGNFSIMGLPAREGTVSVRLRDERFLENGVTLPILASTSTEQKVPEPLVAFQGATLKGRVVDGVTGLPAAGITIRVTGSEYGHVGGEALSGADGAYTVTKVHSGKFNVSVASRSQDEIGATLTGVDVITDRTVELPDLCLLPGVALDGVLIDDVTGLPIKGGEGTVTAYDQSRPGTSGQFYQPFVITDGTFRLRVAPGLVRISVVSPPKGYLGTTTMAIAAADSSKPVEFRLIKSASVVGILVDADGKPVARKEVCATQGRSWPTFATTDSEGRFQFTGLDPRIVARIESDPSDWPQAQPVDVSPSTVASVRLVLRRPFPEAWVSGHVLDSQGAAIPGAYVSLDLMVTAGATRTRRIATANRTDAEGGYHTSGVPRGKIESVKVTVTKDGWKYLSGGKLKIREVSLSQETPSRYTVTDIVLIRVPSQDNKASSETP